MKKCSVCIITQNEEENIRDCLASVQKADEIVIVDAGSTDRTVEICREFTDRIYDREWEGFSSQKQFALEQCSNEWVLSLDADERVRPELWDEIIALLKGHMRHDGYHIARRSYFLGKWIRHAGWYPGYQVRFFKKSKTHVSTARVHEGFIVQGSLGKLENDIDHYSHPSLYKSLEKLNRYSTLEAIDKIDKKRVRWQHFLFHPLSAFWRKYIALYGFRDGFYGFLLSWISSFLNMVLYMKIWLLQRMPARERAQKIEEMR